MSALLTNYQARGQMASQKYFKNQNQFSITHTRIFLPVEYRRYFALLVFRAMCYIFVLNSHVCPAADSLSASAPTQSDPVLTARQTHNKGALPLHIVVMRDGVGESQVCAW